MTEVDLRDLAGITGACTDAAAVSAFFEFPGLALLIALLLFNLGPHLNTSSSSVGVVRSPSSVAVAVEETVRSSLSKLGLMALSCSISMLERFGT